MMIDYLKVGKIINTHALQGEVRVISNSDFKAERFKTGSQLFIDYQGTHVPVQIKTHRVNKNVDLLKFVDMNHINDVEKYKGCDLLVDATQLGELDETEFYFYEIMGCQVQTTSGEVLGEIIDILQTGANDVWVVKRKGEKDALIPYIEDVVKNVDIENKKVTIELLEGLIQ
ncbi:MAG: ribosome maturation factor RimM [Defluviitaleaceae bacterium]|nr:ribosome maturation factor RimM [Defluviitaleaceae bacterium]